VQAYEVEVTTVKVKEAELYQQLQAALQAIAMLKEEALTQFTIGPQGVAVGVSLASSVASTNARALWPSLSTSTPEPHPCVKALPSCLGTSHSKSSEITSMLQDGVVLPVPDLNRTRLATKHRWSTARNHGRSATMHSRAALLTIL
jgi:hypothetical protein